MGASVPGDGPASTPARPSAVSVDSLGRARHDPGSVTRGDARMPMGRPVTCADTPAPGRPIDYNRHGRGVVSTSRPGPRRLPPLRGPSFCWLQRYVPDLNAASNRFHTPLSADCPQVRAHEFCPMPGGYLSPIKSRPSPRDSAGFAISSTQRTSEPLRREVSRWVSQLLSTATLPPVSNCVKIVMFTWRS